MNQLILRVTNSQYGDINKSSVLSASELDGNFVNLKGEVIYTAESSTGLVTLKKLNGENLSFAVSSTDTVITGGTYDQYTGVATFTNNTGGTFSVSGITFNVKHWEENQNKKIKSDETIVISGNYVLENTNLTLESEKKYVIGSIEFNKYAQIYIGGNLLVKDSNIINNGSISLAGAIIMSGNSTITGTGIIL
ncbi:MAG: hypothetical protein E6R13_02930 [Spirochaetes bacterium]|nr:MAG: hypothetical protein E6R13_02930 [Spirochaetota bacterium]